MFEGLWSIKRKSIGRTTPGAGHPGSRWLSPLFQEGFGVEVQSPKIQMERNVMKTEEKQIRSVCLSKETLKKICSVTTELLIPKHRVKRVADLLNTQCITVHY